MAGIGSDGANLYLFHESTIARLAALESGVEPTHIYNILSFGADPTGAADSRPAYEAAFAAVTAAGGGVVHTPYGVYKVTRAGSAPYSLSVPSRTKMTFAPGATLKHPPGLPDTSVVILMIDDEDDVTIDGGVFDGNWGLPLTTVSLASNRATLPATTINVGSTAGFPSSGSFILVSRNGEQNITYTGTTATSFTGCTGGTGGIALGDYIGTITTGDGINHSTQSTAQNHGIMVRGSRNVAIRGAKFRQIYGDGIWIGHKSNDSTVHAEGVTIDNVHLDISGRHGIAIAGPAERVSVTGSSFRNTLIEAFDFESVGDNNWIRDVSIHQCHFGHWWNPAKSTRTAEIAISVIGPQPSQPGPSNLLRKVRITECTLEGCILISSASDVQVLNCESVQDFPGKSYSNIFLDHWNHNIWVYGNFVYNRTTDPDPVNVYGGCITAMHYGTHQTQGVVIENNRCHPKNGLKGIVVHGTGGTPGDSGTASGVTATTLTDGSKSWTTNAFATHYVRMGGAMGSIESNTATVLTVNQWCSERGEALPTPTAGPYEILATGDYVQVRGNHIDCTNLGDGGGGFGIYLAADQFGTRAIIERNVIRNAGTDAINLKQPGSPAWEDIQLVDNTAWDDQVTPTCTSVVRFQSTGLANVASLTMRNNQARRSGMAVLSGLTSGVWLVNDGDMQEWAGFGAPTFTAPKGSTYHRKDGAAGTCLYVNESGSTTWVAK